MDITMTGWEQVGPAADRYIDAEKLTRDAALREIAEDGCQRIVKRTYEEGLDKYGSEFIPYSTDATFFIEGEKYYDKARSAGGRERPGRIDFDGGYQQFKAGLGSARPNLAVLGELLGVEDHEGSRPFGVVACDPNTWTATVDFTRADQAEIADQHIHGEGVPQRDFYGFAEEGTKEWEDSSNKLVEFYEAIWTSAMTEAGWL